MSFKEKINKFSQGFSNSAQAGRVAIFILLVALLVAGSGAAIVKARSDAKKAAIAAGEAKNSAAGAAAVADAAGEMVQNESANTPAGESAPAPRLIIRHTSEGFLPSSVEVKTGDTIMFVNESKKPMWVASNDHPTHLLYPEFDERASVGKGGSWSFTFAKKGTWIYHNHLAPEQFGRILVHIF